MMTREEMIAAFELSTCKSSPAQMDLRKLLWMNGEYIRAMQPENFAAMCREELEAADLAVGENADAVFALMQERIKIRSDVVSAMRFFFTDDYEYDEKAVKKKLLKAGVAELLAQITELLKSVEPFDSETVNAALHDFVEKSGLGFGAVMPPIRIAVSGSQSGPDLAPVLAILGRETVLQRIQQTVGRFEMT